MDYKNNFYVTYYNWFLDQSIRIGLIAYYSNTTINTAAKENEVQIKILNHERVKLYLPRRLLFFLDREALREEAGSWGMQMTQANSKTNCLMLVYQIPNTIKYCGLVQLLH